MTKEFRARFWLVAGAVVLTVIFFGFLIFLKVSARNSESIIELLTSGEDITTYFMVLVAVVAACLVLLRKQLQMIIVNDEGLQTIHFASDNSWVSWSQVESSVINNSLIHLYTNWDETITIRL